jgi:hypothetical protein
MGSVRAGAAVEDESEDTDEGFEGDDDNYRGEGELAREGTSREGGERRTISDEGDDVDRGVLEGEGEDRENGAEGIHEEEEVRDADDFLELVDLVELGAASWRVVSHGC